MILGLGNDIIEIARIQKVLSRYPERFLKRVFTTNETKYCLMKKEPALHLAGRFAAKEAIVKALGTGFSGGMNWTDIEIDNDPKGKPFVIFSPFVHELFGTINMELSISHCHKYAIAVAIWYRL